MEGDDEDDDVPIVTWIFVSIAVMIGLYSLLVGMRRMREIREQRQFNLLGFKIIRQQDFDNMDGGGSVGSAGSIEFADRNMEFRNIL